MDVPEITRDLEAVREWLWAAVEAAPGEDVLPLLGDSEWLAADESTKLASLATWALIQVEELRPEVIAARLAAEIALGHREYLAARKQASAAISGGFNWRSVARRKLQDGAA